MAKLDPSSNQISDAKSTWTANQCLETLDSYPEIGPKMLLLAVSVLNFIARRRFYEEMVTMMVLLVGKDAYRASASSQTGSFFSFPQCKGRA